MYRYIVRRVLQTIPVLIGVSLLVFLFLYLIPGDPATTLLGERATAEGVAQIRRRLGLDRPLIVNLPYSYAYNCPADYNGLVLDLILFTVPSYCERNVQYKAGWSLLRWEENTESSIVRVINPGQPDEKSEQIDLAKAMRLIGVSKREDLKLTPGQPGVFTIYNGTITITENSSKALFSDFLDSQYFNFVGRILHGDLGRSIQGNVPIADEFAYRFPGTVELALAALLIAVLIGIPIGILSALYRNSWLDTVSMFGALIGVSMPVFVLGLLGIYLFSVQLGWLPTGQRLPTGMTIQPITGLVTLDAFIRGNPEVLTTGVKHLLMPAFVLATIPLAIIARITRSAMLEVLNQDYVRTARAKGLQERMVVMRHALRNAMLPIVTVIGLQLGRLLSGAVLTETVFSWQGIGRWLFEAIEAREYPIIQSVSLLITLIYVGVNLVVDLTYAFLNPRIRYE